MVVVVVVGSVVVVVVDSVVERGRVEVVPASAFGSGSSEQAATSSAPDARTANSARRTIHLRVVAMVPSIGRTVRP